MPLLAWLQRYGTAVYAQMCRKQFTAGQKQHIARELLDGRLSEDAALLKYELRLKKTLRQWVAAYRASEVLLLRAGPARRCPCPAGGAAAAGAMANRSPAHAHRPGGGDLSHRHPIKGWCQAVEIMRRKYPHVGVGVLCGLFGKTRNAFYDHQRRATAQAPFDGLVLALVADIREDLPRLGPRKFRICCFRGWATTRPGWAGTTCLRCWPATACSFAAANGGW